MRRAFVTLCLLAPLYIAAACAPMESPPMSAEPPQTAEQATEQDTCGMAAFAHLIGTPAGTIDPSSLPPRARIITPESMVTQDFSPERLNVITGTDGRVSSLRCF